MTMTADEIYLLNKMNSYAAKTQLGQLISNAESVVAAEIALANSFILVGNALNLATAVAVSGDVSISNTGVVSIGSGVIVNADINASAAIAGSKISPDFGSQNITTTGKILTGDGTQSLPSMSFSGATTLGFFKSSATEVQLVSDGDTGFRISPRSDLTTKEAYIITAVSATSTADVYHQFGAAGVTWGYGIDNSDSETFKLSLGTVLGTNDFLKVTTGGVVSLGVPNGNQEHNINGRIKVFSESGDSQFATTISSGNVNVLFSTPSGGTGDASITFRETASTAWSLGRDDSASGAFSISADTTLGTSQYLSITTAGAVTIGPAAATSQHHLLTTLEANGAQVATLTNLPAAATAGNPVGWIKITVNNGTSYIPFWQ